VSAINSPPGSIANGATITITWSYTPQSNALPGTLSVIDNTTKNTVVISSSVNLASQSLSWTVNVPAGTYYLALNDGSGDKYSGTFIVFQVGGATPAAAPSSSPATPTPAVPSASGSPAAKAPAPVASNGPQAPSGASSPAQPQSSSNNVGIYIGIAHLKNNIHNWTSGNEFLDDLIQSSQMRSTLDTIIEWVPIDHFEEIEFKSKGGFGSIFTATWIDGRIVDWDEKAQKFVRSKPEKIVLKLLDKSNNASIDFFKEAITNIIFSISNPVNSVKCYGLTKYPDSSEYMLILKYMNDGDLNAFLFDENNKYNWKQIYSILQQILNGLCLIHGVDMVHKDIHPGNILSDQKKWYISDFGTCDPLRRPSAFELIEYCFKMLGRNDNEETTISDLDFLPFVSQVYLSNNKSEITDYRGISNPKNKSNSDSEFVDAKSSDLLIIMQDLNNDILKYNKSEYNNSQNSFNAHQTNDELLILPYEEVNNNRKFRENNIGESKT
ncbi:455_t:CDS:2, partial [Gigaspora rosea]